MGNDRNQRSFVREDDSSSKRQGHTVSVCVGPSEMKADTRKHILWQDAQLLSDTA